MIRSGSVIGKAPIVSMPHWGGIISARGHAGARRLSEDTEVTGAPAEYRGMLAPVFVALAVAASAWGLAPDTGTRIADGVSTEAVSSGGVVHAWVNRAPRMAPTSRATA